MAYISKITPLGSSTTYDIKDSLALRTYNRNDIGISPNFDDPGVNGFFEIRNSTETTGESGTKPFNGYGAFLTMKTPDNITMMQLAGGNSLGWYIRGKQSANVTLDGLAWHRLVTNSGTWDISINGNAATATKSGVATMWGYFENNNELNFGGTNNSSTIYIGYRAKDSKPVPTKFIFGGSTGIADLQAKTVYLGSGTSSYISSSSYTGKAATAGTADSANAVAWSNVTGKPIELGAYSGALNTNGWKTLGARTSGAKIYIAYNNNAATWNSATYSSSMVFGNADTKGLIDIGHNLPIVSFGGSSNANSTDDAPKWYFKLSGTSEATYTFPTSSKTLAATDGTGASGTWGISITGSAASCTGNAATATSANLTTVANRLAYYTNTTGTFGQTTNLRTIPNVAVTPTSGVTTYQNGLRIWGTTYGNTANQLKSNTAGLLTYGDGGPQIQFGTQDAAGGQQGALIYTDHDNCGAGASFHFVSDQTDWNVNSKRFVAKTSTSIGVNTPNTSYNLYVNGTSYFNGNTTHNGIDYFANGTTYYINNSGDTNLRRGYFAGTTTADTATSSWYNTGALEIRENGRVGNAQSTLAYAPTIGFHWSGRIAATLKFHSDGNFYFRKQNGTDRASIDANLIGNASTADKWSTDRTLTIGYKAQTVNGSANVSWNLHDILNNSGTSIGTDTSWDQTDPGTYYVASSAAFTGTNNPENTNTNNGIAPYRYGQLIVSRAGNGGLAQFYVSHNDSNNASYGIHFRTGWNNAYLNKWSVLLDSQNYTNWTVTKTGTGASGTWGISITGSAASCTGNAATADTWKTARTLTIGNTGKSVNGSANVSWSKSEILGSGTTSQFYRGDNTWASITLPYGETLPSTGSTGDIFLQTGAEYYELPVGGATGRLLMKRSTTDRDVQWTNNVYVSNDVLFGAAWNDYAEYRKDNPTEEQEAGKCVYENGDGSLSLTTQRLMRGCEIISDTFGFAIGQDTDNGYNTPIASSGRVLAFPYESIKEFSKHIGWPVCSGPNGTVSIMTEEEEEKYPSRIIGTISEIPKYKEWGTGKVQVNGRIWIRIK